MGIMSREMTHLDIDCYPFFNPFQFRANDSPTAKFYTRIAGSPLRPFRGKGRTGTQEEMIYGIYYLEYKVSITNKYYKFD
jgi:hypothetical protein